MSNDLLRLLKKGWVSASLDARFYAYWTWRYAQDNKLSWPELLSFFQCNQEAMFNLGLCRISTEPEKVQVVSEFAKVPVLQNKEFQRVFFGYVLQHQ